MSTRLGTPSQAAAQPSVTHRADAEMSFIDMPSMSSTVVMVVTGFLASAEACGVWCAAQHRIQPAPAPPPETA